MGTPLTKAHADCWNLRCNRNRNLLLYLAPVAQWIARSPPKGQVGGSNPLWGAII